MCLEETDLDRIFKSQITTLSITFVDHSRKRIPLYTMNTLCADILTKFNKLRCLKFRPYSDTYIDHDERLSFLSLEPPTFFSSSLTTLHINVKDINDCLYLLDGRLTQLHSFYVDVHIFGPPWSTIVCQVDCFRKKTNQIFVLVFSGTIDSFEMFFIEL